MTTHTTPSSQNSHDGRELKPSPAIIECWPDSHAGGFLDTGQDEQLRLLDWIYENLRLGQGWHMRQSSYSLKHLYEEHTRHYVTNAQLKDAMIISGYQPKDRHELNHHYRIHPSSPAFTR